MFTMIIKYSNIERENTFERWELYTKFDGCFL